MSERPLHPLVVPSAALALAAALVVAAGDLGRWLAVAILIAVAPDVVRQLRGRFDTKALLARLPVRLPDLPWWLLGGLTVLLLWELMLGRPPVSRDHSIHYFQTNVLVDELIPSGRWRGWSTRLNAGYPFGESYPTLGYLLVGATKLVTFGLVDLRTSYAWGLLALWVTSIGSVAWLAHRIAREVGGTKNAMRQAAWAAAIAGVAWLIDPGSSRQGGWNYLMFHGVWPQQLSTALWVLSLPLTLRAFERPSLRRIALAGLVLGGSVLTHPFGLLTGMTSMLMWPGLLWATGRLRELPSGAFRVWGAVHLLGLACASGWIVTFMASAGAMARTPVPWQPLGELATELLGGELFQAHRAWVGPLAVVGLAFAIKKGRVMAWAAVTLVLGLLLLGSEATITVLRFDLLVSGFKNLQFPRYAIAIKPLWCALAGVAGAKIITFIQAEPAREQKGPPLARWVAALVIAPALVSALDDAERLAPRPVGGVYTLEGSVHAEHEAALHDALLREGEANDTHLTVAFLRRQQGGGTYPLLAIADVGADVVLDGHIPAVNYRHRVGKRNVGVLHALGVTHVIHDRPLEDDEQRLASDLEYVEGDFGDYKLARLRPDPDVRELDPAISGTGDVTLESVEAERITLRVDNVGPRDRLLLALGPYRKWTARLDGKRVQMSAKRLHGGLGGMRIDLPHDGEVVISYDTPPLERWATWFSAFAIGLALAGLARGRPLDLAARLHSPLAKRISLGLSAASVLVVVAWAWTRQEGSLVVTWERVAEFQEKSSKLRKAPKMRFARDLTEDGWWRTYYSNPDLCDGTMGKDAHVDCSHAELRAQEGFLYRDPYLYRCVRVSVPGHGWAEVELGPVEKGEGVFGFMTTKDNRSLPKLTWRVNGSEFSDFEDRRRHFRVDPGATEGHVLIELHNEGRRDEKVCVAAAAGRPKD